MNDEIDCSLIKSIWIVSREFNHIAEAGGVKNVVCSMAVNLQKIGVKTTVFIPLYKCTDLSAVSDFKKLDFSSEIKVDGEVHKVEYASALYDDVKIIFVMSKIFSSKRAVYVYTDEDAKENPEFVKGTGHKDSFHMNSLFQQAVLYYGYNSETCPALIHCHDAATSLVPVFARNVFPFVRFFASTKFVVTIHNAGPGYLQSFPNIEFAHRITNLPENVLKKGRSFYSDSSVEPFLLASYYSHLTTVSPWYAEELYDTSNQFCLLARDFAQSGTRIEGITNGIDYDSYDPKNKAVSLLETTFSPCDGDFEGKKELRQKFFARINSCPGKIQNLECCGNFSKIDDKTICFVYQGRMVSQKGVEIFSDVADRMLAENRNVCFLVHGQGQEYIEKIQEELAIKYMGRYVYIKGFDRALARNCVASADFLVLPSIFEPCCLEDFIAQIYGTIPIAHAVGGLNKIINGETGFTYSNNTSSNLYISMLRASEILQGEPEKIREIQIFAANTVKEKYSWASIIRDKFLPYYKKILID
ncbi:MAG: glycogen/starch synthase [Treponemataceae bacterium]|nr:glycogen/starch synthase [Treponemataceae bacterium]